MFRGEPLSRSPSSPGRPDSDGQRVSQLDVLRVVVVLGLVLFHSALVFDTDDDFYVKNDVTADLAPLLAGAGVVWAMPLLFFVAGLGAWHSLTRRTTTKFVTERCRRLLIPLLFGVAVLVPIQVWLRLRADSSYRESYGSFYRKFFDVHFDVGNFPFVIRPDDPPDLFETGHLWFLVLLLTFTLLLLPLFVWARRSSCQWVIRWLAERLERSGVVLSPAIGLAALCAVLPMEEGYAAWNRWAYLAFFAAGFLTASDGRFLDAIRRQRVAALALTLSSFVPGVALFTMQSDRERVDPMTAYNGASMAARALFGASGWFAILAILGFLLRESTARAHRAEDTPQQTRTPSKQAVLSYFGPAVLPLYVLHQPVVVVVAFQVVSWEMVPWVKYVIIATASLGLTLAVYEVIVRRTSVTRFLFGMR